MKRIVVICIVLVMVLTGCGKSIYPELPANAIAFENGITYKDRTYSMYGTLDKSIKASDIKECIGYIVQTEENSSIADPNDKDTRVYLLTDDKEENFIMVYYTGTTLMNQPDFYRADDTKGKEIEIPKFICDLDYDWWK